MLGLAGGFGRADRIRTGVRLLGRAACCTLAGDACLAWVWTCMQHAWWPWVWRIKGHSFLPCTLTLIKRVGAYM